MDDSRWERYGALGGLLFVVLMLVSVFLPGSAPAPSDSAEKIASYFADNDTAIEVGAFLAGLAVVAALWWFGTLWRAMVTAEGGRPRLSVVAGLGLVIGGGLATAGSAVGAAVAVRHDVVGPDAAQFFYTLWMGLTALAGFGLAAHVGAVSATVLRTGFLPRFIGWVGALDALGFVVAGGGAGSDATAWFVIGIVSFLVWLAWVLVVSVLLWRGTERTVSEVEVVVLAAG